MIITMYGTRGSSAVARADKVRYGGNTTCVQVESELLPPGMVLAIDGGTGMLPLAENAIKCGMKELVVLHTHYHHDHTQGLLIAAPIFMENLPITIVGPRENGMGPRQVYAKIMEPVLHPVSFKLKAHHLVFIGMQIPATNVICFHPRGGMKTVELEQFNRLLARGMQIPFNCGVRFPVEECLIVKMFWTNHPERTITYRFEEPKVGGGSRVFVFSTDEECRAGLPSEYRRYLSGVHLLIQDAQYSEKMYRSTTAGYGHGTPAYVAKLAEACAIPQVGFTHHDPSSSDADIDAILEEGRQAIAGSGVELFACYDYQRIEL